MVPTTGRSLVRNARPVVKEVKRVRRVREVLDAFPRGCPVWQRAVQTLPLYQRR